MNEWSKPSAAKAMLFEISLGFVGLLIAWAGGIDLADAFSLTLDAVARGLVACVPLLLLLYASYELPWQPLTDLRQQVERIVLQLFRNCRWWELALVSVAAGVGEETLFRGALQPLVASWTSALIGLMVVSLLFGLAHAMSTVYFVAATLIGLYFGWLAQSYGDLTAPTVAHAVYDFIALMFIQSRSRTMRKDPPAN